MNSAPGDSRTYQASDFADYFGSVLSTGLLHTDNIPGMSVSVETGTLNTIVSPGKAIMKGHLYENTTNLTLTHGIPEATLNRIDRIVLRLDLRNSARNILLQVKTGVASSTPVAPDLQRDTFIYEISLAQVRIRANTSTIDTADITDERFNTSVAGLTYSLISTPSLANIATGGYSTTVTVAGQTNFNVPFETFDKDSDGLTVFIDGQKATYDSYELLSPRTVSFNNPIPVGSKIEFEVIRGVIKLPTDYQVNGSDVGINDIGGFFGSTNVEGALQEIGLAITGNLEAPPAPTNFLAGGGDSIANLTWVNPISEDFAGVRIMRKEGSYPLSPDDGLLVYQGANNAYTDNTVINDTPYFYSIWSYALALPNLYSDLHEQTVATPIGTLIYGVNINELNSNPESSVTRTDMAVGMTVNDFDSAEIFKEIKPCMFKNGTVQYYLNPNDFAQKADGSPSVITGADGDVMIEFPKFWWKISKVGSEVSVKMSNRQVDSTWKCYAHTKGVTEKDKIYIGAYLGVVHSGTGFVSGNDVANNNPNVTGSWLLRSVSGIRPYAALTISNFRTIAQRNGAGYQIMSWYQLMMLQILYVVKYKNLNSQLAIGKGVSANTVGTPLITGGTNGKGMNFGEQTGQLQMKGFGVEDFWGNLSVWIDGIISTSSFNMLIGTNSFSDTGVGYTDFGAFTSTLTYGWVSEVVGNSEAGFMNKGVGVGSATTYYSDIYNFNASKVGGHGYGVGQGDATGAFCNHMQYASGESLNHRGARLTYS